MIRVFSSPSQKKGERGELAAVAFLVKQGYIIVERNVAHQKGEIDIIAKYKGMYYFYEVKTALEGGWFNPAENMTQTKRRRFLITVEYYCMMHKIQKYQVALIVVTLPKQGPIVAVETLSLY